MITMDTAPNQPQTEAQPSAQFAGIDGTNRSARRAAALAAISGATPAPKPEAPPPAPADEPEAHEEASAEPHEAAEPEPREVDGEEEESSLAAVVRARKKANEIRRQAEAQRLDLERERMRLDLERREIDQLKRAREAMAKDPLAGLRELGVDLRDLTERAALEGTPEAQMRELREALEAQKKELDTYRQTQAQREMEAQRGKAESEFFALAAKEEEYPYLAARAAVHPELVKSQAYALQEQYYARTGKVPSLQELAEALDYIESESYRHVHEREARRGASASRGPGNAPAAGKAAPSRTLTTSRAGERTKSAPSTLNMNRMERREYVKRMLEAGRLGQ